MYINFFLCSNIFPYSIMSIFTVSPIQLSRQMVSHTPYPPPILAKHHTWYSADADLFISICRILFGLHCAYFCQSRYFQTIMDVAEPEWPMPKGSQALYPLPFWWSRPTLLYTIPLIFLSTSQFRWHQTGLEKYTWLLHRLVSTGTYSNSYMQTSWNMVQLFHLCQKTSFASCQLILWDGSMTTTSLASTT